MRPQLIGIGNPFRSDDGIGPAVLNRLRPALQDCADLIDCAGDPSGLLSEWENRDQVIVIDACRHDAEPTGKIFRFNGLETSLPAGAASTSSHAFSLADVIALGKQLDSLPTSLTVYAVVGGNFSAGDTLSKAVQQAVDNVCDCILQDIGVGDICLGKNGPGD